MQSVNAKGYRVQESDRTREALARIAQLIKEGEEFVDFPLPFDESEWRRVVLRSRHWIDDAEAFIRDYYDAREVKRFRSDLPSINAHDNQHSRALSSQRMLSAGITYLQVLRERPVQDVVKYSQDEALERLLTERAEQAEEANLVDIDPLRCFVIMSFSGDVGLEDAFQKAMRPAVEKLGFKCVRINEQHFNGSIMEQVQENIRKARFIIADLTEARPNCYYELGIAHALHKDVILLAKNMDDVHFDVKGLNFIHYKGIADLEKRLGERIAGTILHDTH